VYQEENQRGETRDRIISGTGPRADGLKSVILYLLSTFDSMQITSTDGNMVVDFYPVKDWDGKAIATHMLKVLSFRGDTQKKMLITKDEFYYQVKSYVEKHKYNITDESMLPQFHNFRRVSYV